MIVLDLIIFALDMMVPRFITEDVGLTINDAGSYEFVCNLKYVMPDDAFEFTARAKSFNFFGFALFPVLYDIRKLSCQ